MDRPLQPDTILSAEFAYIAQTAFQANEDRARVSNFYLVMVGSFVAAMLGLQLENVDPATVYGAFAILFLVMSLNGLLTLLHLVRLREAWFESVSAMNQIKRYYEARLRDLALEEAFRWKMESIPPRFKPWSISFLLMLQVALLGGAALGAAVIFWGQAWGNRWEVAGFVAGLVFVVAQVALYRALLRRATRRRGAG